jgi:outer membrane lipoprotein-sorting protein
MKLKIATLLIAFFTLLSNTSYALQSEDIWTAHHKDLLQIENYLNSIKTLEASFIQKSHEGQIIEGKFYLSRPGKMRLEYQEPSPIVVIVNGSVLTYHDLELEETSHLRTNSTPASFLTRKRISFKAKDVQITDFQKKNDYLKVSIVKKNKKEAGEFSLIFKTNPLKFSQMEIKDDMDQTTIIAFTKNKFGKKLSNNLFAVKKSIIP